jgi:CSLREA domain-containing protein
LLRAVVVVAVLAGALVAAPNALANFYTVNSAADTDNGVCDVFDCTLREAINAANSNAGLDTITFGIGIGGSYVIQPHSALPDITDTTTLDATTQTGYAGSPLIQLDGTFAGSGIDGLGVFADGTTIRGLAIRRYNHAITLHSPGGDTVAGNYLGIGLSGGSAAANRVGVSVVSPNNTIGGPAAADRNVISGNSVRGVEIAAQLNHVFGNYIGTDASGSFAVPNNVGVLLADDNNTIGDNVAGDRNVISGNATVGVLIAGASSNTVDDNYIGTDADGTSAIPNGSAGIQILGGTTPANGNGGSFNVISGNNGPGVLINTNAADTAQNTQFTQNFIGTDASGEDDLGNTGPGVLIAQGSGVGNSDISNNTIAFNSLGIASGDNTSNNRFLTNSIHDNDGLGIELDGNANAAIEFPTLSSVARDSSGNVEATGTYHGVPSATYLLDFYASPSCDSSGNGEGQSWLGTITTEPANGSVDATFDTGTSLSTYAAPGSAITATATDDNGNTSEFSACKSLPASSGATFTVNSTADTDDGSCDSSPDCTLREALNAANALPGTDTIAFNLPGPSLMISPTSALPPITDDVIIDGNTQPGTTPGTPQVRLDGADASASDGLDVSGGLDGSTIRGLSITGFSNHAIILEGAPTIVEGSYLGIEPDGTTAAGNGVGNFDDAGIEIRSGNNQVGGTTAATRNVISGNNGSGIHFANEPGNVVLGNRIGTNAAGTAAVPNTGDGVHFEDVNFQTIGGTASRAGNLISGNGADGIFFNSGYEFATGKIQGNTIGLAADGATPLPNEGAGVRIEGVGDGGVHLGGVVPGAGNVISGNLGEGVSVSGSDGTSIQGNRIGTSADGLSGVPNALAGGTAQVFSDSSDVLVGGTTSGARNVISGNGAGAAGLHITGGSGTTVEGNYIGTDVNGEGALGNGDGVLIDSGSSNTTIGGNVPGAGNVISGNSTVAIHFVSAGTGNHVLGNLIGTNASGTSVSGLGNDVGIDLEDTSSTIIGSASSGAGNVIGGSVDAGIILKNDSNSNTFAGNFIGSDRNDALDLGNNNGMKFVNGGGSNNLIGPNNVFAHSTGASLPGGYGIELDAGTGNRISANSFHDNANKGILLNGGNNGQAAPTIATAWKSSSTAVNGTLTSTPSTSFFIELFRTPTCSGQPQGQTYLGFATITTDGLGKADFSFSSNIPGLGQKITATATNQTTSDTSEFSACATVTPPGEYLVNTAADHDDSSCDAADCTLREAISAANARLGPQVIFFDIPGSVPITMQPSTALPPLTEAVTIDGTTQPGFAGVPAIVLDGALTSSGDGLVLAPGSGGSTVRGLVIDGFQLGNGIVIQSDGNTVEGSYIGTTSNGFNARPNVEGIEIDGGSNNTIGGTAAGARNVISANNDAGVLIDGRLSGADGNTVAGNYIGVDATGQLADGNLGPGVWVMGATNTTVGGATLADANVIANNFNDVFLGDFKTPTTGTQTTVRNNSLGLSGDQTISFPNSGNGVEVMDGGSNTIADNTIASEYQGIDICGSSNNTVVRNLIGSNSTLAPDFGVFNQGISMFGGPCPFTAPATGNVIGGAPGDGNTVLNSQLDGIAVDSGNNTVSYNTVSGTKSTLTTAAGVEVSGSSNTIGPANVITGNAKTSVRVSSGTGNRITQNSIDANGALGIDLVDPSDPASGVTPNDPGGGDGDSGPNNLQNFPVLTSATANAGSVRIVGTLTSAPSTSYRIEYFASTACDGSGNGEGGRFIGFSLQTTNGAGTLAIDTGSGLSAPVSVGEAITATATDVSTGDTSEFSHCATVTEAAQTGPTFTVNTNADPGDGICTVDDCTLREAINAANASSGNAIHFDLPGSTTIAPSTDLPAINVPMTIDATTQPDFSGSPLVVLDGNGVSNGDGFQLLGGGSVVRGFDIVDWQDAGVFISDHNGNTVAGNYIGIDLLGVPSQNAEGVIIRETSDGNTIGGTGPGDRNVISGNGQYGIDIGVGEGPSSDNNVIQGNYIGLRPDGSGSTGVTGNSFGGIVVGGGSNVIGGTTAAARNYISANDGQGVLLEGPANVVKGNTIGLDVSGAKLGNTENGVDIEPFNDVQAPNTIGDTSTGGNVISGNLEDGIYISSVTANPGTVIEGNLLGTDPTGTSPVGNELAGIEPNDASYSLIHGNTISGNLENGIYSTGFDSHDSVISGNKIGTNAAGTAPLGNLNDGILFDESSGVVDGNLISGNVHSGVEVLAPEPPETATVVTGNLIGTNAGGNAAVGNGTGVTLKGTAGDTIGGNTAGDGNVISGNLGDGVDISSFSSADVVEGNFIGTNAAATLSLANSGNGVRIVNPADASIVRNNTIMHNGAPGIAIPDPSLHTDITANSIDLNTGLGIDLGATGITANDSPEADGFQNFPTITGAVSSPVSATITGSLASTASTTFNVDLFESPTCDASGNGEGRTYLGTTTVTTGGAGTGSFKASVASIATGHVVTATATDPSGNTSEFSVCKTVAAAAIATNLSLTAAPASVAAGAAQVKLSSIPPSVLLQSQSNQQSAPVNQTPVNQTPINQTAATSAPVNQTPINQTPVNQTGGSGFAGLTQTIPALGSISLSSIPLVHPSGGWDVVLAGTPLAGIPLQNVTLRDVYALNPPPGPLAPNSTNPLTIGDLDLSRSPLGALPAMAFALGKLPLSAIPTTTGTYTNWCTTANVAGVDCSSTSTVLSAGIQGAPVNQTPVNQTPVNQTLIEALATYAAPVNQTPVNQTPINQTRIGALPVNQTPINQTPVNQTPINQLSLQAILAANAPVNQTPVNQTPVNQLSTPNDLFYCVGPAPAGSNTIDCTSPTTTLGSAFAAHAIRPGVTLGDLRRHDPLNVLAAWTIADLRDYGNMTIGDLLASLPQPNNFTLADVLLLVLGSPSGVQGLSFEGINIFDTGLPSIATGSSTIQYQAQFTVQAANGGPSGVPSSVAVTSTLPDSFLYVPGSSKLVQSPGTCSTATPIADPASTTLNDGRLRLAWTVPTTVGQAYSLCFTGRPGIILGPQGASLDAQPSGGATASVTGGTVNVGDTLESNDTASTAPQVSSDSFYLSYLTSSSDTDYYRFAAPPAGTVMTFHLSHLPADYDLVVYGPPETQLRPSVAGAVPLDEPPITDSGFDPTHATDTLPSQTLDDLRLQTGLPMVGVSASRGTDPEDIVVTSQGGSGFYTVQVTGYNGATSPDPYMLRVATAPPRTTSTVPPRSITGTTGPALGTLPTGLNTVFVVNRQQLEGIYGSPGATNVMNALSSDSAAFTSLGFPNVVLSVDAYAPVRTAYTNWNANPGSPAAANGVVQAINSTIDSQIRSQPNGAGLKYIVIVGGDNVIPFARLDDFTVTASNEAGYASTFGTNTDLYSTLNAGQMLSDDPYGTTSPVPYLTRQLYVPNLSVGRLVETPADIVRTLNNFVSTSVGGHLDPTSSLTTGYDFLFDGAQGVNAALSSRVGPTNAAHLFDNPAVTGDSWDLSQLLAAFLPSSGAPSITSLNGHASHYQFEPPNSDTTGARSPLFTSDMLRDSTSSLANRLVFSMGCHAGLSVADATVTAGATTLDWPQAYAQKSAGAYLGNTGYGYGDTLVVAYSEELNRLFAQRIAAGSTVGDALAGAKQAYYGELGVFGVYDEKSMAEFTLYGLPMWSVTGATGGAATATARTTQSLAAPQTQALNAPTTTAQPLTVVSDPTTGLDAETFSLDPTNTEHVTTEGRFWSGPDGVQVTQLRPIQPKTFVSLNGATGHGALITELTSGDTNCVDPVYARPVVDLTGNEPEVAFADVAFPSKLQTVRTFVTPTGIQQRLVLVTGQFFTQHCSTNPDPQVGVQRLFSHVAGRVFRSQSTDYIPPAFQLINATKVGTNAAFAVDVTDRTPTGAGQVKQVVVGVRSGTATAWTFVNLAQSSTNPTRWSGGAPISGTDFEYFVQAVDAAGNVAVSTNKGFYFVGAPAPAPPTGGITASVAGAHTGNGWFTASPALSVSAPQGVTFQVSIDGGPFGPAPTLITGDGVHTVDVRASNGGIAELIVPVDTTPPEITIVTPATGAQYVLNSQVKADYTCRDSGSGVVTACAGPVANGANIDTGSLGTKTFTVGGVTDAAGHTAPAKSVTYTVVLRRKILFASSRTSGGDIYAMNPDGSGVVQLTATAGPDEQPAWSPDGSKIAFASKRADVNGTLLDIYTMDPNGQNVRRLTTARGDDTAPAWSPDGTKIAFQSNRDGNVELYVMNADGTNQTRLTNNPNQDIEATYSPDGQKIAFASNRNGGPNIWVMDANGSNQKQLTFTTQPEGDPAWSPDGTKIAFSSKRSSTTTSGTAADIFTMKPDGTSIVRLTSAKADDLEPTWSRDNAMIAFTALRDGNPEIYIMNANGSGQTRRTTNSGSDRQPDW